MFTARSHETLVVQPTRNRVIFNIRFLAMGFVGTTGIRKDARLQEPNFVFSEEATVPQLDTLTTKDGKSTLAQYQ